MSKRSILITAATKIEVGPLLDKYPWKTKEKGTWFLEDNFQELLIICTGVGSTAMGVRTAMELAKRKHSLAINMGIAGSYSQDLELGSSVFVASEQFADLGIEERDGSITDLFALDLADRNDYPFQDGRLVNPRIPENPFLPVVNSITTNRSTGSEKSIQHLRETYQPDIENMEGAGFFMACLLADIPFLEIRSISNYVTPRARETWKMEVAIRSLNKTIIHMVETLEEV